MVLTGTRAAFLGLAAGMAVWLFWSGWRVSRRALGIALGGAFAVILAAWAFYISPLGQPLRSRARWFAEDPWGGARPLLWRDSLRMGWRVRWPVTDRRHSPLPSRTMNPRDLARAYPDFAHESPHNIFLDALVAQGVPGLLLLAALVRARVRARRGRSAAGIPAMAACLAAALAAGIVSQQFTVFTIPTAVIFFATIALAEGLDAGTCPAAPLLPVRLAAALFRGAHRRLADHALALAQRDLAAGDLAAAAAHYDASGRADDLWYSRALLAVAGNARSIADPNAGISRWR